MSSIVGMVGPLPSLEEKALNGAKRSRLSLHFTTPRVRRWLLVQLVTMPVGDTEDETETRHSPVQVTPRRNLGDIVDNYRANQALKTWA
jgi:hypothetical protein